MVTNHYQFHAIAKWDVHGFYRVNEAVQEAPLHVIAFPAPFEVLFPIEQAHYVYTCVLCIQISRYILGAEAQNMDLIRVLMGTIEEPLEF